MNPWYVHYKNKWPGGYVSESENSLDVFCAEGIQRVALRKNGAQQWQDESEKYGLAGRHDLAPIPRDARVFKAIDGKLGRDESAADREQAREKFMCSEGLKVLSCEELKARGWEFCPKGNVLREPKQAA